LKLLINYEVGIGKHFNRKGHKWNIAESIEIKNSSSNSFLISTQLDGMYPVEHSKALLSLPGDPAKIAEILDFQNPVAKDHFYENTTTSRYYLCNCTIID